MNLLNVMQTVFIIIGGLADLPEEETGGRTPLMMADTPGLDALARVGCCGSVLPISDDVPLSAETAVLSLLGYDFGRGVPFASELSAFGRTSSRAGDFQSLRYFVLPKFSGHGVVVSASDSMRGIGKLAMLRDATPSLRSGRLAPLAETALRELEKNENEFVLVYVDVAAIASEAGDLEGKIRAIEEADRLVVSPVADYVWNAKVQMNMVVASDLVASWKRRRGVRGEVPAVVYFNDDLPYDTERFNELSVVDGPLCAPLPGDLIKKLLTFEPILDSDDPVA